MRLNQREQIYMMDIARKHPGPLADWLVEVVQAQQMAGVNSTFELTDIPVPLTIQVNRSTSPVIEQAPAPNYSYRTGREAREAFLKSIGYQDLPLTQRRAIRKFMDATIDEIRESDLLPGEKTCWMGKHDPEEWGDEDEDHFLWIATGKWSSGIDLKKWGCQDCAVALSKAHPEAKFSAN
jgi:hypothetical protein